MTSSYINKNADRETSGKMLISVVGILICVAAAVLHARDIGPVLV